MPLQFYIGKKHDWPKILQCKTISYKIPAKHFSRSSLHNWTQSLHFIKLISARSISTFTTAPTKMDRLQNKTPVLLCKLPLYVSVEPPPLKLLYILSAIIPETFRSVICNRWVFKLEENETSKHISRWTGQLTWQCGLVGGQSCSWQSPAVPFQTSLMFHS